MARRFSYLVIGAGSIGTRHIRNLRSLGREVVVCESSAGTAAQVRKDFPGIIVHDDLNRALKNPCDIAVVCTPSNGHLRPALGAAQAGCHLFVEKPLSHTLAGTAALLNLVKKKKLATMVGCNMRFQYGIQRLKQLSAGLGTLYYIRCQFGQFLPDWRKGRDYRTSYSARSALGGGIVLDAIHELDYLLDLMPGKPAAVCAMIRRSGLLEIDSEDNASISLGFAGNALGEIHLDYLSRAYVRRCEIAGSRGSVCWDETEGTLRIYSAKTGLFRTEHEPAGYDYNQSYIDELLHFERSIEKGEDTVNSVFAAEKTLRLALAAKSASKTGRQLKVDWF